MYAYICMKACNLVGMRQASTMAGFASSKSLKQVVKFISLPKWVWVTPAGPAQGLITQGYFYASLEPASFPPFLQSRLLDLFLAYGSQPGLLPSIGFQPRRLCFRRGVSPVVVVTGRMLLTPSGYRSGVAMQSCNALDSPNPKIRIPGPHMSVVPRWSHSLPWAPSPAARMNFTSWNINPGLSLPCLRPFIAFSRPAG